MARNKDLARLPRNPKISAVLVWEKDKEGKSGRLVFSDIQYEPIIIEVDELKRMHKPLIRIVYYRDGQEVAYAILPKDIGPLNAQNVMGCIDVRLGEVRSYHRAPDVFKMIFYKALAFVKSDNFGVQLQQETTSQPPPKSAFGLKTYTKPTALTMMKRLFTILLQAG